MRRRLFVCLFAIALIMLLPVSAMAVRAELVDHAALLTPQQSTSVEAVLDQTGDRLDMDVVIVTVNSLNGSSSRWYAENFYDNNGYADTGVLLLVCMQEREYWVCTTGAVSVELEELEDAFVPLLSAGDYESAFLSFAESLPFYLTVGAEDEGISFGAVLLVCIGIGVLAALITTLVMKSQLKSVRPQRAANSYVVDGSFLLTHSRDIYLYRTVRRSAKPKSNSSSSSGRSHGGGGGRF